MIEPIDRLLNEIQTISESYDRVAEATGENFNIFSVLKVETDEVSTHSRFIAELLNPRGSHGKGDEFLKIFINYINDIYSKELQKIEIDTNKASVITEKPIENGRIDIFIKDPKNNIILIENKIYASEQPDQLYQIL
ncbi:MAG: PD-(D/E)XK nuclease family protein [Bacteroidales bacterium]|nr:PD-(D/E)XK nuclease family protein [Bacteroidales bacterium]